MLFHCDDSLFDDLLKKKLTDNQRSLLSKQGVKRSVDFFLLTPKRYHVRQYNVSFSQLKAHQPYSLIGKIRSISKRTIRRNLILYSAVLITNKDHIPLVWFNQRYIIDRLKNHPYVVVTGKLDTTSEAFQVSSFETSSSLAKAGDGQVFPEYPDLKGVSNKLLVELIKPMLTMTIQDLLPDVIRSSEGLLGIHQALQHFHFPKSQYDLDQTYKRLAFDEMFMYMFPRRERHRNVSKQSSSFIISPENDLIRDYLAQLPYQLTGAQQRVWDHISDDFNSARSVFRLIQGDVGSGKTDVAILALLAAVGTDYKSALLVPTEILAEQHFLKLKDRCLQLGVQIFLLKGKQRKKDRQRVLDALVEEPPLIVVGTHALVQDSVNISKLGLVVIDEQHRFGVFQRQILLEKSGQAPHCLFMSATPIPRTLMLTHYGDLDHDIIDEMPPGRKPPKTYFGKPRKLNQIYEFIRIALKQGRQAYVVYPLIEESEHLEHVQPAVDGFETLQDVFQEFHVGLLHGQMPNENKQQVMQLFKANQIQVLVSTTVIEVGVDVPNATVMVIMNAERFGLSQLHQLRGRVGRGSDQAHCFLVADPKSEESKKRIQAMVKTTNGFELAEEDLKIRGPGNLLGTQQSGDIVFAFANLSDKALIQRIVSCCDLVIKDPKAHAPVFRYFSSLAAVQAELLN